MHSCSKWNTKWWIFGAYKPDVKDDLSDFVIPLAKTVAANEVERGIAICGSGVGASIAANKIAEVRAAFNKVFFSTPGS